MNRLVDVLLPRGSVQTALTAVDEALAQRRAPELIIAKAKVDLRRGKANEAFQALEGLMRNHRSPDLYALWGESARRLGDTSKALQAFERALELDPKHHVAFGGQSETFCRSR